jgi:photosystem II stability/assembly factor-like uncharacterized protein
MIILNRFIPFLFAALFGGIAISAVSSDHDLDVEYAEQMPLATESMLLDITNYGETLVAVGERGHIVISRDDGSWQQAEHVPTRSTLTSIFNIGERMWAGGHDAAILTSGDGGQTWTQQFYDPDRQQAVMDIFFTDENNGMAIGSYGLYLRTSDGGHTWEPAVVDEEIDYHLNKLVYLGVGRWLIAGEAGYSYRSYDDGISWESIEVPYQGSMWGALQTGGDCVLFYGLRGHVMESCDFGTSWIEIDTGSDSSISGSADSNGLVLLAANGGTLLTRDDGGEFEIHHHSSGVDFSAVIALEDGSFVLVGEDGVHKYPETGNDGDGDD